MISVVFGLPGSGKSTILAACADRALHHKPLTVGHWPFWQVNMTDCVNYDRVYCNFPIKGCYMLQWDHIGKYDFSRSLLLIDEITLTADSRKWKNFGDDKVYFFAMHRHYKCDVIVCAQSADRMDKTIRDLAARYFYVTNEGRKSRIEPIEPDFKAENLTTKYKKGARLQSSVLRRKKYYSMFDSFACVAMPENPANLWEVI